MATGAKLLSLLTTGRASCLSRLCTFLNDILVVQTHACQTETKDPILRELMLPALLTTANRMKAALSRDSISKQRRSRPIPAKPAPRQPRNATVTARRYSRKVSLRPLRREFQSSHPYLILHRNPEFPTQSTIDAGGFNKGTVLL
jgi:hypothetical protein